MNCGSYARRGAAPSVRGDQRLLRMRNGLRRSQELDDLVDVLASSIGALTNPRTNCPHREKVAQEKPRCSRSTTASRRSCPARDVVKPRPRRARHPQ